MSQWLKQSTAVTEKMGPFVDSGDGNTVEDSLTIQKADVRLAKNGGNMAAASADQGASDAGAPYDEIGYYDISFDATDTNTLGRLKAMVHKSGSLPVWLERMVLPANVYDALVGGSDLLQVDLRQIADAQNAVYLAAGTVTTYTDLTNIVLPTSLNIRKGSIIVAVTSTGLGAGAIVQSYDSGTGATVLEDPGFPVALGSGATTFVAFPGPNMLVLNVDDDGNALTHLKIINDVTLTGAGVAGDKMRAS